jgi:sulfite reductase (NADPH) flavoprotein alpha-component
VVGPASATQRAWLAGFLAGLEASAAVPQPAAPPASSEPLTIVFASESGNSEKLAGDLAKAARKNRLKPTIIDMADLDVAELASAKRLVFIAATWGEGEPPSRSARAYAELMGENAPRLDGVEFGVLALGDTAYVEFCAVGRAIDDRLATLGAKRVVERADCDLDFAAHAAVWVDKAVKALAPPDVGRGTVIEVDFGKSAPAPKAGIVEAEIIEHVNLNSSRSEKETSISPCRSKAARHPMSPVTRSTSIPRTILPRWTSCSRARAFPAMPPCVANSSARATSRLSR